MPEFTLSDFSSFKNNGVIQAIGFSLSELYFIAYTGKPGLDVSDSLYSKMSTKVFADIKDLTLFPLNTEKRTSQNTFAYERKSPDKSTSVSVLQEYMLADLNRFLGFKSEIQERDVEVLNLIIKDAKKVKKLKSKGSERKVTYYDDKPGNRIVNLPFQDFILVSGMTQSLRQVSGVNDGIPTIIDATGINFNIDVDFDADPTDWQQVLEELHKNGLDLVKGKAKMMCIVICDAGNDGTQ
ncbi:MAG: hypothetical protein EOO88_34555 [Pedobacter sp.]|nr:MAG: hypothetical protein EOO88_34555 [Pedobacter sp.]